MKAGGAGGVSNHVARFRRPSSDSFLTLLKAFNDWKMNKRWFLADEPTAALDSENGRAVMQILADIAKDRSRGVLVVTHDQRLRSFADRVIYIEDGRIVGEITSKGKSAGVRHFEPFETNAPLVIVAGGGRDRLYVDHSTERDETASSVLLLAWLAGGTWHALADVVIERCSELLPRPSAERACHGCSIPRAMFGLPFLHGSGLSERVLDV
jgi:hypothetical protein